MAERVTVTTKEVYNVLKFALRARPDLGIRKALADGVLDSPNPFEPTASRRPQRLFVLACLVAAAATASFLYFNFWQ